MGRHGHQALSTEATWQFKSTTPYSRKCRTYPSHKKHPAGNKMLSTWSSSMIQMTSLNIFATLMHSMDRIPLSKPITLLKRQLSSFGVLNPANTSP